ncbi:hypothetical protein LTR53_009197 [Teratosphaeriaceae sp. CCFEE 6253]|nr:hypothetical protein LTR53_009197 [Teratosphaeriaceae sp. CCFEE 6253]
MTPTLHIDLASVSTQLTDLLKQCVQTTCETVKAAVQNEVALAKKAERNDIEGLPNAAVLLPLLRPDATSVAVIDGVRQESAPKLHVIVSSKPTDDQPSMRAFVVFVQPGTQAMVKFIFADKPADTAAEALQKLLIVTSELVERAIVSDGGAIIEGRPVAISGGGWCSAAPSHIPAFVNEDKKYWGKSSDGVTPTAADSTAAPSPNTSFCSDFSDSSTGSTGSTHASSTPSGPYNFYKGVDRNNNDAPSGAARAFGFKTCCGPIAAGGGCDFFTDIREKKNDSGFGAHARPIRV